MEVRACSSATASHRSHERRRSHIQHRPPVAAIPENASHPSHPHPERQTPDAKRLVRQDLRQKLTGALGFGFLEKRLFWPVFDDFAAVHEDNSIGDSLGETHLVGDH
jgi:hypothetical protein